MKRYFPIYLLILLLVFGTCFAQETSDTVTVSVTISASTQISVLEDSLSWTVAPGTVGIERNVQIQNTGSVNLTNIEAELNTSDIETSRPTGVDPTEYASGGFLVMHNSSETDYLYVGRVEWNLSSQPSGISNEQTDTLSWGWFKNTTSNYLWTMSNGTGANSWCNQSGANTRLKTVADTGSNRDMSSNVVNLEGLTNGEDWGVGSYSSGPLANYCVAMYYDCSKLYIYKFDWSDKFPACGNRTYFQDYNLTSQQIHIAKARVFVPTGVPQGATSDTILTITATAA